MVTLHTVEKHLGHVLGELGAANRTEAVARARELSLIPYAPPVPPAGGRQQHQVPAQTPASPHSTAIVVTSPPPR